MNATIKQRYRGLLKDLLARLQPEIAEIVESVRSAGDGPSSGELSNAPFHLGDRGTDEFLQGMAATVLANEAQLSSEIQDALQRLDDGRFGVCESCGAPIPVARLDAVPYTRYCVSCAAVEEGEPVANLNAGRPQAPADVLAETGEMGERRLDRQRQAAQQEQSIVGENDGTDPTDADRHAAGTAGGGTAVGGLAGSTIGHGDPDIAATEDATGSSDFDAREARESSSKRKRKL